MTNLQLDASAMLGYEIWVQDASGTKTTIGKSGENNKCYVFEPTVSRKLDAISTFTFSLYTAYQETDGWKENELSKLLKPETKVNVSLTTTQKTKKYAFTIKKITQDCTNYKNSYTCEDYYVNELSKSGYSISFSEKERNNINTLEGFANKVIDGLNGYYVDIISETQTEEIEKNLTIFDPTLDRYVDVCKDGNKFHYSETKYEVDAIPVNMIANGYDIKTTNSWTETEAKAEIGMLPKANEGQEYLAYVSDIERVWGLKIGYDTNKETNHTLVSLGLSSLAEQIGDLFKGNELIFEYKLYKEDSAAENKYSQVEDVIVTCEICEYTIDKGKITSGEVYYSSNDTQITKDLTKQNLLDSTKRFGIFVSISNAEDIYYLSEIALYKKVYANDELLTPTTTLTGKTVVEEFYYQYDNDDTTKSNPIYISGSLDEIEKTKDKYRTVNAKESNRFNILQSIAEAFQTWCIVDGYRIVFSDSPFLSDKNAYEINYGQNLTSIKRNYDSGEFATKLIVKDNNNKYAPNGFCSISRASKNTSKENVIYDFDYYGDEELQGARATLIAELGDRNEDKEPLTDKLTSLASSLIKSEGNKTLLLEEKKATENEIKELKDNLLYKTKYTYEDILDNTKYPEGIDTNLDAWRKEPKIIASLADISIQSDKLTKLEADYAKVCTEYDELKKSYDEVSKELQTIASTTESLISEFEKTYRHLIREASWTSNDYIDNDKYYEDAIAALHKSSKPKVSYDVSAIYFGHINQNYDYDLGSKVLIDLDNKQFPQTEGSEIIERKNNSHYEEDLIDSNSDQIDQFFITEFTLPLDNPEKGSIKIKNYRSPFKDLFQKIQLNSQQLQFHSGEWDNASAAFTVDGNVRVDALADAFANNSNVLKNVSNQTVIWDDKGITTTNRGIPTEITRITSGGVFLTTDGGTNWTTGITAKGINARTITSGEINTGLVNIYSCADIAFRWDVDGITAYKDNGTRFSNNNFVRYNQFGIFGINDGAECDTEEKIKANAKFYLGWDGLFLNKGVINMVNGASSVKIDPYGLGVTENVFEITSNNKQIFTVDTSGNGVFTGNLLVGSNNIGEGFSITEHGVNFKDVFAVEANGNAIFSGDISAASGEFTGSLNVGNGRFIINESQVSFKDVFTVTKDGKVIFGSATDSDNRLVYETGTLTIPNIIADKIVGGTIGTNNGITIAGWKVNDKSLSFDVETHTNWYYLGTKGIDGEIGSIGRSDLVFKAGNNFGVDADGNMYCQGANINGILTCEAPTNYSGNLAVFKSVKEIQIKKLSSELKTFDSGVSNITFVFTGYKFITQDQQQQFKNANKTYNYSYTTLPSNQSGNVIFGNPSSTNITFTSEGYPQLTFSFQSNGVNGSIVAQVEIILPTAISLTSEYGAYVTSEGDFMYRDTLNNTQSLSLTLMKLEDRIAKLGG